MVCYTSAVPTLSHAINTALREMQLGLAVQRDQGSLPLIPERVHLTLTFALDADGTTNASPGGPHSVTIEFKTGDRSSRPAGSPAPPAAAAGRPATDEAGEMVSALSQLFGAPGFDSSARATVFREVLEGMPRKRVLAVLAAVSTSPSARTDDATRMAAHLLRGVIQSGPTKALDSGVSTLRKVLSGHSLAEVLRAVESEWKTQSAWL